MSVGDSVEINLYESTTNWIYWDKSDVSLGVDAFPRVDILIVAGTGVRLGNYEAPVESNIRFQFDVWTKEKANNQIFEIGGVNYTGEDLAEYLAYKIMEQFEDHINDLNPVIYDYEATDFPPRDMEFNEEMQCHHKVTGCQLKMINVGRIS